MQLISFHHHWLRVDSEAHEEEVEIMAGEFPLERLGAILVAALEGQQPGFDIFSLARSNYRPISA